MTKTYVLNLETQKIELHFSKAEYKELSIEDKKLLGRAYLFSGSRKAWVSRSTKNHYSALQAAKRLGFVDGGEIGERLSYAEEVERQIERAEGRQERYEAKVARADQNARKLQQGWNEASQDWSFVTQPIIAGHAGSQRFGRQRQRLLDRFHRGFEEYRKGEYFRGKADLAEETANMHKFKSRRYLSNRIEECNKNIRAYEQALIRAEGNEKYTEKILEKMEYEIDKLAYITNKLDEIGGIQYSKDNLKVGYEVRLRHRWDKIVKLNPKTVEVKPQSVSYTLKYPYAEIEEIRIPSDWKEETEQEKLNPYEINDIVAYYAISSERIIKAFQVIKKTAKSVTLQEIKVVDNEPQLNLFVSEQSIRRSVKRKGDNTYVVNYGDRFLYKYTNAS